MADRIQAMVTNWTLEARFHDLPPLATQESTEQVATRSANSRAYSNAVTRLQASWVSAYETAHSIAVVDEANANSTTTRQRCGERRR